MTNNSSVKTTCPYCGVGCGVLAEVDDLGVVSVKGDPDHPASKGRLCSKGTALGETVYLNERLLYPKIAGQQVSWEQAIATVAGRFTEIIKEHGSDAVAFYVSGQLLTEDYYVANKLMKGFIGSANIDTNSRLCMSSAVAGQKRAFGEDVVPCCYEDLDRAKLIVLTGTNTAWCHPVLYQRIVRAKKANPDLMIVLIDPRRTQTSSFADIHLAIKPGTDSMLFNGLLAWLDEAGERNELFTDQCTSGAEEAINIARKTASDVSTVALECGLDNDQIEQFYRLFSRTERVVTVFSQGINQSSSGTDKVNSIINCHLFTGRIGRPGMGPFSFTGQPNAMGGREVGGLSNQLAAHMEIANTEHHDRVQRFWQAPQLCKTEGLKAVELFQAIDKGQIKAVWIMATNPVVSMPEADQVKAALQKCELVIVSDCMAETDTSKLAHIQLPALAWGEKNGTVTNSERCISRQRSFLSAPGQAKPDWWTICEVARKMGHTWYFQYQSVDEIFREHARLSGYENKGERSFNISGLGSITFREYDNLQPVQWPVFKTNPEGTQRLYGDGQFNTIDKKARFIPVEPRTPVESPTIEYPFILNTGRIRDHWHTMTRTGMSPRLSSHTIEPYVEIHPDDASLLNLDTASWGIVKSPQGSVTVKVKVTDTQKKGCLFIPIHWNDNFSKDARIGSLIKAHTDPVSGQPEFKHSVANIAAWSPTWHGFILTRHHRLKLQYSSYWSRSRGQGLWRYEVAGNEMPEDWANQAHQLLGNVESTETDSNWIEFFDKARNHYRAARFAGNKLESCIFICSDSELPQRNWLLKMFQKDQLTTEERQSLLTGNSPLAQEDTGKTVCSCFNVGIKTLEKTIRDEGLCSTEEIGALLQAGTNCGSCLPELGELLKQSQINL